LGKASIRLELICSTTVLVLGREGFRLALLRIVDDHDNDNGNDQNDKGNKKRMSSRPRQVNNVAWLSVPVSLCLAAIALTFHLCTYRQVVFSQSGSSANSHEVYDYKMAGILYCLATAIEIHSEPCMIACL